MGFIDNDYKNKDFRNEQALFRKFFYDEINSAPGFSWCTEYYYRRMPDGKYRFVMIDYYDHELYEHAEFDSPEDFAKEIRMVGSDEEEETLDEDLLGLILSLCPKDIRRYRRIVRSYFNNRTASLLQDAYYEGYWDLVKALLPDFGEIRAKIYPASCLPGISIRELDRRKEILREYFRSEGYKEKGPDFFKGDNESVSHSYYFDGYEVIHSSSWHGYRSRYSISLEDTEKLREAYPGLSV